mmetsp:Transcript_2299/g.4792  ORF Transcript_2299/g.4792 Transcript_2299/m.4792 type:complete len:125 (+) Transcript_2299:125-499(+)|eukprot:CAMPEP_0178459096 /NCGR_PEP_ID=MMETSP0689_2-20121128/47926_1 /TAXON_ID=160604 /ORGANISM="Amphidinium massartii, Strain CS-259" /LENGTH=124 /DNA_ID=CAMNT_0020085507 /DNA_START=115 /DNA_END=489 /DNA_ORIENTATION=-
MAPKAGGSLNLDDLDKVLATWNWAKGEEAAMKKKIEECKTKVEAVLKKTGMDELSTSNYKVSKRTQARESVSKKDLPADVWATYAKKSEFSVLTFTALKGKRASATAKAKAKAKSKAKAKATKK